MAKTPEYFCNYPFKRSEKKPKHMKREDLKLFLYTDEFTESSDLNWLHASTEHMTVVEYQVAPGGTFDPVDIHAGDEVYYVEYGQITMLNPRSGQVVQLEQGEYILMPKGCPHKAYNFTQDRAKMLAIIAPRIWEEDGPPLDYDEPFVIYKDDEREGRKES